MNMLGLMMMAAKTYDTTAESIGYMTGYGFVVVLIVLGIVKCIKIAGRPKTSTLCVWSLALVLVAFASSHLLRWMQKSEAVGAIGRLVFGCLVVLVCVAAVVLAIVGLAQYRGREGHHNQGKAQAVWALILGFLFLVLIGTGIVQGMKGRGSSPLAKLPSKPGSIQEIAEFNFKIQTPAKPWVAIDAKSVNPLASTCFMRTKPQIFFLIVAENGANSEDLDYHAYVEILKGNLRSACESAEIEDVRESSIGDIKFQRFEADCKLAGTPGRFFYDCHAYTYNGFFYQLLTWGASENRELVREGSHELASLFQILDPDMSAVSEEEPAKNTRDDAYGFSTDLAGKGWQDWGGLQDDQPGKLFGAMKGLNSYFVIDAVKLRNLEPEGDDLVSGMISRQNLEWPGDNVSVSESRMEGADRVWDVKSRAEFEGTGFLYRIKVIQRGSMAYMLAGWFYELSKEGEEIISEAMGSVELFDPSGGREFTEFEVEGGSNILNKIGLAAFKRSDYEAAIPFFKAAYDQQPSDTVKLGNVCEAYIELEEYGKGLSYLKPRLKAHSDDVPLRAYSAYLTAASGDLDGARPLFLDLYKSDYKDEDDLLNAINLYIDAERASDAIPFTEAAVERNPTARTEKWLGTLYARAEDYEKSFASLSALVEKYPENNDIRYTLGEIYNEAGEYAQAEAIANALLEKGYDSARTASIKGWSEYHRDWTKRGYDTFKAAAVKFPNDEDIQYALQTASASLGKGSNVEVSSPIDPVIFPEKIEELLKNAKDAPDSKGFGAQYRSFVTGIQFEKGKLQKTTTQVRVKIHEKSGIDRFTTLYIAFDPLVESLFVNEVRVFDSAGEAVVEAKLEDFFVTDESDNEADNDKYLNIPVPGLKKGYTLQYTYTKKTLGVLNRPEFQRTVFSNSMPQDIRCYFITGDTNLVKHKVSGGLDLHSDEGTLIWSKTELKPYRWESLQPDISEFLPMVTTGSGDVSWEKLGRDYLKRIEDRLVIDDDIRALSQRLLKGRSSEEDKITALAEFVRNELKYKAIEFGVRGRTPNKTAEILSDKYGDCKDHSLLLLQLLRAADIKARLALVNSGWMIHKEFHSIDQFNHMIVQLPGIDEGTFVDCTDKHIGTVSKLPPVSLGGKIALVLDFERGGILAKIANYPDDSEVLKCRRSVSIVDESDALVSETVTFAGYDASSMRYYLLGSNASDQEKRIHNLIASEEPIHIESMEVLELDSPQNPLQVKMVYRIHDVFERENEVLKIELPALWENYYLEPSHFKSRKNPFELEHNFVIETEVGLTLDRAIAEEKVAALAQSVGGSFCKVEVKAERGVLPNSLLIRSTAKTPAGSYSSKEYAQYEKERREAMRAIKVKLELPVQ